MSKKKLQERKQKAKERATAQQKVKRRLFASRRARYEKEIETEARDNRTRLEPIRNDSSLRKIGEHLAHNLKVLEALEEEYVQEQLGRKEINDVLEAEGYKTIEQKMDVLKKQAHEIVETIQSNLPETTT